MLTLLSFLAPALVFSGSRAVSWLRQAPVSPCPENPKPGKLLLSSAFHKHLSGPRLLVVRILRAHRIRLPVDTGKAGDPSYHRPKQSPGQVNRSQHQPVVPGMLDPLPPVFTSRCCKLVSDELSIFFGS